MSPTSDTCMRRRRRGGWFDDLWSARCSFPISPRNTWSNLGYLASGSIPVLATGGSPAGWVMGISLAVLAIGSGLYHGLKEKWANDLDLAGMCLVFGSLSVHGYDTVSSVTPWLMAGVGIAFAAAFVYLKPGNLDKLIGVWLLFASIPAFLHGTAWLAVLSLALYGYAYIAWNLDVWAGRRFGAWLDADPATRGPPPSPPPIVGRNGHAIWHELTGPATALMFVAQLVRA